MSMGVGRDWPNARGIFISDSKELAAWVNEEDHLRIISGSTGGDIWTTFDRFCKVEEQLSNALSATSNGFAFNEKFGFLATDLGKIGTGLHIEVTVRLPRL